MAAAIDPAALAELARAVRKEDAKAVVAAATKCASCGSARAGGRARAPSAREQALCAHQRAGAAPCSKLPTRFPPELTSLPVAPDFRARTVQA
jgi:hypothetical protein